MNETRQGQLRRAYTTTNRVTAFQDQDRKTLARKGDRGCQPIRPGTDDHRVVVITPHV